MTASAAFVLLIGEFDRRGSRAAGGLRSCAHWLNWRVGTSLGAAREQVRVGRALNGLSCLRAAFQSGERTTRRHLHAHHVVFWSKGGRTALSNLVTLCGAHHRFVHEGGWDLHLERCGALRVVSPQGEELPAVPSRSPVQGDGLVELNGRRGLEIDDETLCYGGERFDLGLTVDGLLSVTGRSDYRVAASGP